MAVLRRRPPLEWEVQAQVTRWPRIGVPVLALEHDLLFPPRGGRLAAAVMPQGRFAEIAGHAHGGAIAAGDQIGPAVLEFFAEH
ncbi:alpha/beta fold hydrolase [Nonomuraea dietziae]|uniref:alpha/beta fold hydrolase n=1 Tax=Nonomuraea dietziae TaxID=65515 RepID=UPI00343BA180